MSSTSGLRNPQGNLSSVFIVSLKKENKEEILGHYLGLSKEDNELRFMGVCSEEEIKEYALKAIFENGRAFGAYEKASSKLIGVAHVTFEEFSKVAELSLSVDAAFRGLGIGKALIKQAQRKARKEGCTMIKMDCLSKNEPMKRWFKKLQAEISDRGNICMAWIYVPQESSSKKSKYKQ